MTTATSQPDLLTDAASGTGGSVIPMSDLTSTRTTAPGTIEAVKLSERAKSLARNVDTLHKGSDEINGLTADYEWKTRIRSRSRGTAVRDLVSLAEMGFAWREVARMLDVSVPAVTKWRRGESIATENQQKIFRLTAACDVLASSFDVEDIASWFQLPLRDDGDTPITPVDLWVAGRQDLVFESARERADVDDVLDKFEPGWRDHYRSSFETFRAGDGHLSIRTKEQ